MERVEIGGIVQALTPKAALIHDYGAERWIPRKSGAGLLGGAECSALVDRKAGTRWSGEILVMAW